MKRIGSEEFQQAVDRGEIVVDTRLPRQVMDSPLPGAYHLTLEQVQAGHLPDLSRDTPLYLVCEHGQNSELVGLYLEAAGFTAVFHLDAGLRSWRSPPYGPLADGRE